MSVRPTFFLLEPFQTVPIIEPHQWLGRVVKNFAVPLEAWTPEQTSFAPEFIVDDPGFSNVQAVIHHARSHTARVIAEGLFGFSDHASASQDPTLAACKVRRIRLSQDEECFARLLEDQSVRMKVMGWLGIRKPVYFVVGYLMTDVVRFKDVKSMSSTTELKVQPPIKAAAAAFGVPLAGAEPVEVGAAKSTEGTSHITVTAKTPRIFAIEYRVVRRRLTSIKDPIKMKDHGLTGSRMFDSSGQLASDVGADRAIEIVLDEDPISEFENIEARCFGL